MYAKEPCIVGSNAGVSLPRGDAQKLHGECRGGLAVHGDHERHSAHDPIAIARIVQITEPRCRRLELRNIAHIAAKG